MNRHESIRNQLTWLQDHGVIDGWQAQSQMPGKRWTVWGSFSTGRSYTTAEIEIFITGADVGLKAGAVLGAGAAIAADHHLKDLWTLLCNE